jgi:hypothetical protein
MKNYNKKTEQATVAAGKSTSTGKPIAFKYGQSRCAHQKTLRQVLALSL